MAESFGLILSFVLQFLPLFLIPFAFRLAGGAIAQISGFLMGQGKRGASYLQGDERDPNSMRSRARRRFGAGFTAGEARALNKAKAPGASFMTRRRAGLINAIDGRVNERQSRYTKEAMEISNMIAATGNDDDNYAANWFSIRAGQAAPEGLTSGGKTIAGTTANHERFFDSKGREISESYAKRSESKLAFNQHEAGRTLEYPMRKIQTDGDMGNYRRAFAAAALRQNLDDGEIQGMHAASTFEHKDKFPEMYYEKPRLVNDANGKRVVWDDISSNTEGGRKSRNGMVSELHKTRESFRLGSIRDATLRSWNTERNRIQNEMAGGQAVSAEDATFYAQTNEILDSMVQRGIVTREGDAGAEMASTGASAAAQGTIRSMMQNRRYEVAGAKTNGTVAGAAETSVDHRVIYKREDVDNTINNSRPSPQAQPTISRDQAIAQHAVNIASPAGTVGKTVQVTGDEDRSAIPREWR